MPALRDLVVALRPNQWTKNIVVLAAFFFAFWDKSQQIDLAASLGTVIPAAVLFCLVSSGIYVLNDIIDIEADRRHPTKRLRPIAAGAVPLPIAGGAAAVLLVFGLAGALLVSRPFALAAGAYVAIQVAYSLFLKKVALVDIIVIATGFVLRAIAGGVALNVVISPWLLLCAFLLALFLALCKRRHEKILLDDEANQHRASLDKYDQRLLDQLIAIVSAATIVSYAIYTLSPGTIAKFGSARLGLTIPFVMFGIFRYLDLVYRHERGGRPEKILLTDLPILINLALYGVTMVCIFLVG